MLASYGIPESAYSNDAEMFDLVHQMRARILQSPSFNSNRIIATILFRDTIDRQVGGLPTADYVWTVKGIVPFLKIDLGLQPESDGVQLMKPITDLDVLLEHVKETTVFGTKMRSFIAHPDETGIDAVVAQQFDLALRVLSAGLVPIVEPEVDIRSDGKAEAERLLKSAIKERLDRVPEGRQLLLKLSLPTADGFYSDLVNDRRVLRVLALSGGYTRQEAVAHLARNPGVIASFSRALLQGLSVSQSESDFDSTLGESIEEIYRSSVST